MTVRVFNGLGGLAREQLDAAGVAGVEIHDMTPDGPAEGLTGEVMFGGWGDPDVLARYLAAGVRWVQLAGTGIDGVAPVVLESDAILTNVPGASAVPIAEFVLASMLAFEKRFPEVWLAGPPPHWNFAELDTLEGKTLGIFGFGGIGQAIATRALAFDMRVVATRRRAHPSEVKDVQIVSSLEEILPVADHLVLAAPATHSTRGIVGSSAFSAMKPGVHLVNIARGSLVDQDALRAALDSGRVAAASLDTVDPEPLPEGHWMYDHPKLNVTAHVSWASRHAFRRPVEMFVENLRRYVAGEDLRWVVDLDEGY